MKLTNDIPALLMLIAACILVTCGILRLDKREAKDIAVIEATRQRIVQQRAYIDSVRIAVELHHINQQRQHEALLRRAGIR